jgi:hypothetical protein
MGFRDGLCHTEIRLDAGRPRIIESQNRFGGDAIPDLVRAAYGIELDRLALGQPFGLAAELPDRPSPQAGACTRFLVGHTGEVVSVEGVEDAARQDDVILVKITARAGDAVRPLQDNWDRLGLVAVRAPDTDAAVRRACAVATEHLRVNIRGDDGDERPARVAEIAVAGLVTP